MKKQAAFLTDAVAAADDLTDVELRALLTWYVAHCQWWWSSTSSKRIGFRDWLDSMSGIEGGGGNIVVVLEH